MEGAGEPLVDTVTKAPLPSAAAPAAVPCVLGANDVLELQLKTWRPES